MAPTLFAALGLLSGPALAARPDEGGGLFAFDETDLIESLDGPEGRVRVHYSVEGTNLTRLDDDDGDGLPDYPALVAATAEEVLAFYEAEGFAPLPTEAEVGLSDLGGSAAFDIYLVDFGGSSDGHFAVDRCTGGACAGHAVIENDFKGYGYPSLEVAVTVLTSHELFHGVQAATDLELGTWLSEGTATWAEHAFDPGSDDFLGLCGYYLDDTQRSLDRPPAGAGSGFSYGTALFFAFMEETLGRESLVALMEALEGRGEDEGVVAIEEVFEEADSSLQAAWPVFSAWNLATGSRAGLAESYWFAEDLDRVDAESDGAAISEDHRFYPLATSYFRLDHDGGPVELAFAEDATGLVFSVHRSPGGSSRDPVEDALLVVEAAGTAAVELGEQEAGVLWLVGSYPASTGDSLKIPFCFGPPEAAADCELAEVGDTGDAADTGEAPDADEGGGCGCGVAGSAPAAGALVLSLLALAGRRRRGP